MIAFVRRCDNLTRDEDDAAPFVGAACGDDEARLRDEVRAIVAKLPEPVDPDPIEARELFIESEGGVDADATVVAEVRRGDADVSDEVQLLLKGIKRGRKLESSPTLSREVGRP